MYSFLLLISYFKAWDSLFFTGDTAQEYIQSQLIDVAKEKYLTNKSISEIAYESGSKYPQHFTRLFKQRVGQSPNEYRSLN